MIVHFSPHDYSIFGTFAEWTGAGDFFPASQGPSKPFESMPGNLCQILSVTIQLILMEKESDDFQKRM